MSNDQCEVIGQSTGSLSERTVAAGRAVLAGDRGGWRAWRAYAAFAGPAVIASIAYVDPGNFATNIQAGAKYGYTLLWVVLVANLIAMLFQALSAKLGIVTGKNLAEMCRDHFSPPLVWGMWGSARLPRWRPTWPNSWAAPSVFRCCFTSRCSPAWS
jgi:manganese transport protein